MERKERVGAIDMATEILECCDGDVHCALDACVEGCMNDDGSPEAEAFWDHVAAIVETAS